MRKLHTYLALLTTIYLLLPAFIFAWGWLRWQYALITSLVGITFLAFSIRDLVAVLRSEDDPIPFRVIWHAIWPGLLIITIWMLASGVGGFGQQNPDYDSHNALLKALISQPWPLKIDFDGQVVNYVYYLGYYLPSALIGRLLGWGMANIFSLFWAFFGVVLAFLWFWQISGVKASRKSMLILAAIFCLASGMDAIGYYVLFRHQFEWGTHLEPWAQIYQYTSQTALMYWVPQHTIAAWLIAGLTFACLNESRLFRYLGMAIAASILWSPFGAVGIIPYLLVVFVVLLVRKQFTAILSPAAIFMNITSLWIAAIYLLYIYSNQYSFPIGILWNLVPDHQLFIVETVGFWGVEFAVLGIAVIFLWLFIQHDRKKHPILGSGTNARWGWFALVGLVLLILPFFKMGYSNDLVMRGSIPSLFFLWAFTGQALVEGIENFQSLRVKIVHALIVCFLLIGTYTSFTELGRSVSVYHFGPPDIKNVGDIASASYPHIVAQRIGREDTFFYHYLGR